MINYNKEKELLEHSIEFFPLKHKNAEIVTHGHVHPAIEFIYVTEGTYEIGIDNELFIARRGDLILFRSNVFHTLRHVDENNTLGECFVLKINPSLLFRIFTEKDSNGCVIPFIHKSSDDVSYFPSSSIPNDTLNVIEEMIREYHLSDGFFYPSERAFATMLLISLLRFAIRPKNALDDDDICEKNVSLIHQSVQYINENYASDITPTDCAAAIHLSYSYFAKLFRAVMGKTFKEYLTGVRLAKAHSVLLSTDLPITDVASTCGYSNLSYFISEYKKIYGKTPRDTRKELSDK